MTKETLVGGKTFKICAAGFQGRISAFGVSYFSLCGNAAGCLFHAHVRSQESRRRLLRGRHVGVLAGLHTETAARRS